jgi:hypothetical protein
MSKPWVERCEPHRVYDLHEIFWETVHGYLHLPSGRKMILETEEDVSALEEVFGGHADDESR